jgi:hypothetical protein
VVVEEAISGFAHCGRELVFAVGVLELEVLREKGLLEIGD